MHSISAIPIIVLSIAATTITTQTIVAAPFGPNSDNVTKFEYRDFQQGHREFDDRDFDDAYRYWLSLAREGVPEAQYNIGRMHAYGEGVTQNYEIAYAWFLRAQHNGADEASDAIRQLLDYLTRDEIEAAEGLAREISRI